METKDGVKLEGAELRSFLMSLDEFQQMFRRVERRMRDARVVEILANVEFKMDTKADFHEKSQSGAGGRGVEGREGGGRGWSAKKSTRLEGGLSRSDQRGARHRRRPGRCSPSTGACEPSRARWRSTISRRSA